MLASILIIAASLVLFCFWFRQACKLILNAETARDLAASVARANGLSFLEVHRNLSGADGETLRVYSRSLERDYRLVSNMLQRSSDPESVNLEGTMLKIHFRVLKAWCSVSSRVFQAQAKASLQEMCDVLSCLSHSVGKSLA
jgi:hypothetical protein